MKESALKREIRNVKKWHVYWALLKSKRSHYLLWRGVGETEPEKDMPVPYAVFAANDILDGYPKGAVIERWSGQEMSPAELVEFLKGFVPKKAPDTKGGGRNR